jgi:hypothetical protein
VETTLLDFLHIYNVLILLCTVSALRYRRIGEPHVQSDTSGLHLQGGQPVGLLCAEPDDRLTLGRSRGRVINLAQPISIRKAHGLDASLNWYVGCRMFGSWFLSGASLFLFGV